MKKLNLVIYFILFINCIAVFSQNKLVLNGFNYRCYKSNIFLKDEQLTVTSKYYQNSRKQFQFGFIYESKRNDSLFIAGVMKTKGMKIYCTEKYFFDYFEKDSIKRMLNFSY